MPDVASTLPQPYPEPSTPGPYPGPLTPEIYFTQTPIPTAIFIPTVTPPAILPWFTPTPTPLAEKAETARQFLSTQVGVPADQLRMEMEMSVLQPKTGEALWLGRFFDLETGRSALVVVDPSGRPGFLPDFSEIARAHLAQARGVPVEQVEVAGAQYALFPFSQQIAWRAQVFDSKSGEGTEMAFDLEGKPVDIQSLEQAETDTRLVKCGKLDEYLCGTLLPLPAEATRLVAIYLGEGSDPAIVTSRLDEAGLAYQQNGRSIQATLPKGVLFEIAFLDPVSRIDQVSVDHTASLESNLVFSFEETGGDLVLRMRTQKIYGCSNFQIDAQLDRSEMSRLLVTVQGVIHTHVCETALGPAEWETALGALDGEYELVFEYAGYQDHYRFTVTPDAIQVEALTNAFTWPKYTEWLRLPPGTVWFVAQACPGTALATAVPMERSAYHELVSEFYAAVETWNLEAYFPREGVYSNKDFIPPWPGWHRMKDGWIEIPLDENRFYLFRWPEIHYYTGIVESGLFTDLAQAYRLQEICIGMYTWNGEQS